MSESGAQYDPIPLFDTDVGVGAGCHMSPSTCSVSPFVLEILIAPFVATLIKWEGDAIGAGDGQPLLTTVRIIPLREVSSPFPLWFLHPLETVSTGTIGAAAAPLVVLEAEGFIATYATLFGFG